MSKPELEEAIHKWMPTIIACITAIVVMVTIKVQVGYLIEGFNEIKAKTSDLVTRVAVIEWRLNNK